MENVDGYPIEAHILFFPQYMKDICLSMFCDVFHNVAMKIVGKLIVMLFKGNQIYLKGEVQTDKVVLVFQALKPKTVTKLCP